MADVTDATFATEVVERSKTVPVVVDLWAEWCGPCKSLGPILEKVIGETNGLVELAKVDVDANPEVSAAFQVQSIPAVYAMKDGQVVDGFVGAQGEPQVVEFVQRLLDTAVATTTAENGAAAPSEGQAPAGATRVADTPVISQPGAPGGGPGIETRVIEADVVEPGGVSEEEATAIEAELTELLTKVKGDDEVRERIVALLDQLGPNDPRTNTYRRKLATALY
ncbi:MAG: thioredoxin [Acidimicrobiia bacterium]|nr:thioredoxin [Acidimicrobiia bacterium]